MIPFNKPYMTGKELDYIKQAHGKSHLSGDGTFTMHCHGWLEESIKCKKALLTHSCTAALEMSALLLDISPGDEIIMPSYTFVSTANAFVLRGGVPVFVDIRRDTFNIDENLIEAAITPRTKAIVPVHYAGVSCEMDGIISLARRYNLAVVEDAAQGIMSLYKGKPLGSFGEMGALSFHETKNIISGEGGALLVNDPRFIERAEIIREKGTDRKRFYRNEVDKYTWQSIGSSYLPSDLIAAFLWAQMQEAESLTSSRLKIWNNYHELFEKMERKQLLRRPMIPQGCTHNGHMYYILLPENTDRNMVLSRLKDKGINAVFHYVPLHTSPAGMKYCRVNGSIKNTLEVSERVIRLPFWIGLQESEQEYIANTVEEILMVQLK